MVVKAGYWMLYTVCYILIAKRQQPIANGQQTVIRRI